MIYYELLYILIIYNSGYTYKQYLNAILANVHINIGTTLPVAGSYA